MGAPYDHTSAAYGGSARLYDATTGLLVRTFTRPTPTAGDFFGWSVAVSGNYVVAGAYREDTGASAAGSAYLFDAATGVILRTFSNPSPAVSDEFGQSVAVSGNNIVVGAHQDDTGATDAGCVYLYDALTGSLLRTISNPSPESGDRFGGSVAVSGNNILVGAHQDDTGAVNAGSAYLFDVATGALLRTFSNPSPASADFFGFSVAIDGNNVVVGAPGDNTGLADAGIAYLFDAATGALLRDFNNPDPSYFADFGWSVAVSGANVIVGCPADNGNLGMVRDSGSASLFDAATGSHLRTFTKPTPSIDDYFGWSVAIAGNNALAGAYLDDTGATNAGSAYLFDLGLVCPTPTPAPTTTPTPAPPLNDNCAQAVCVIDGVPIFGTNVSATGTFESSCAWNDLRDVWFSYTPVWSGQVTITTCGATTDFDTTLAIFDACDGTQLECNDDDAPCSLFSVLSTLKVNMTAEHTYLIRVSGFGGEQGNFELLVSGGGGNCGGPPLPTPTVLPPSPTPACCPGDADNSGGVVNANDFLAVQANFGANHGVGGLGDADCSGGAVNANDFLAVQANFGANCG